MEENKKPTPAVTEVVDKLFCNNSNYQELMVGISLTKFVFSDVCLRHTFTRLFDKCPQDAIAQLENILNHSDFTIVISSEDL